MRSGLCHSVLDYDVMCLPVVVLPRGRQGVVSLPWCGYRQTAVVPRGRQGVVSQTAVGVVSQSAVVRISADSCCASWPPGCRQSVCRGEDIGRQLLCLVAARVSSVSLPWCGYRQTAVVPRGRQGVVSQSAVVRISADSCCASWPPGCRQSVCRGADIGRQLLCLVAARVSSVNMPFCGYRQTAVVPRGRQGVVSQSAVVRISADSCCASWPPGCRQSVCRGEDIGRQLLCLVAARVSSVSLPWCGYRQTAVVPRGRQGVVSQSVCRGADIGRQLLCLVAARVSSVSLPWVSSVSLPWCGYRQTAVVPRGRQAADIGRQLFCLVAGSGGLTALGGSVNACRKTGMSTDVPGKVWGQTCTELIHYSLVKFLCEKGETETRPGFLSGNAERNFNFKFEPYCSDAWQHLHIHRMPPTSRRRSVARLARVGSALEAPSPYVRPLKQRQTKYVKQPRVPSTNVEDLIVGTASTSLKRGPLASLTEGILASYYKKSPGSGGYPQIDFKRGHFIVSSLKPPAPSPRHMCPYLACSTTRRAGEFHHDSVSDTTVSIPSSGHSEFSHGGIVSDDAVGRWVFSVFCRFSPTLLFRWCSMLTSITRTGSRDLDVKRRPDVFTHSSRHVWGGKPLYFYVKTLNSLSYLGANFNSSKPCAQADTVFPENQLQKRINILDLPSVMLTTTTRHAGRNEVLGWKHCGYAMRARNGSSVVVFEPFFAKSCNVKRLFYDACLLFYLFGILSVHEQRRCVMSQYSRTRPANCSDVSVTRLGEESQIYVMLLKRSTGALVDHPSRWQGVWDKYTTRNYKTLGKTFCGVRRSVDPRREQPSHLSTARRFPTQHSGYSNGVSQDEGERNQEVVRRPQDNTLGHDGDNCRHCIGNRAVCSDTRVPTNNNLGHDGDNCRHCIGNHAVCVVLGIGYNHLWQPFLGTRVLISHCPCSRTHVYQQTTTSGAREPRVYGVLCADTLHGARADGSILAAGEGHVKALTQLTTLTFDFAIRLYPQRPHQACHARNSGATPANCSGPHGRENGALLELKALRDKVSTFETNLGKKVNAVACIYFNGKCTDAAIGVREIKTSPFILSHYLYVYFELVNWKLLHQVYTGFVWGRNEANEFFYMHGNEQGRRKTEMQYIQWRIQRDPPFLEARPAVIKSDPIGQASGISVIKCHLQLEGIPADIEKVPSFFFFFFVLFSMPPPVLRPCGLCSSLLGEVGPSLNRSEVYAIFPIIPAHSFTLPFFLFLSISLTLGRHFLSRFFLFLPGLAPRTLLQDMTLTSEPFKTSAGGDNLISLAGATPYSSPSPPAFFFFFFSNFAECQISRRIPSSALGRSTFSLPHSWKFITPLAIYTCPAWSQLTTHNTRPLTHLFFRSPRLTRGHALPAPRQDVLDLARIIPDITRYKFRQKRNRHSNSLVNQLSDLRPQASYPRRPLGSTEHIKREVRHGRTEEGAIVRTPLRQQRQSPRLTVNRARFPEGSLPDLRMCESCQTIPLVGGFSRDLLFFPPVHSGAGILSLCFTVIGYQDIGNLSYGPFTVTSGSSEALLKFYFQDIPPLHATKSINFAKGTAHCIRLLQRGLERHWGRSDVKVEGRYNVKRERGKRGCPEKTPPASVNARHVSHKRQTWANPARNRTRFVLLGGDVTNKPQRPLVYVVYIIFLPQDNGAYGYGYHAALLRQQIGLLALSYVTAGCTINSVAASEQQCREYHTGL
ncbi:hypothetical protein PR048_026443 [Dryococelus australis]|uniref:Uncharacterized protein n=1 Tax=Dryococelus australis TaxID=614101 RepID=A0ABQ9GLE9_9NEOP|nr:hypothetical protein PR048_026443 [Dryococelus australis]